MNLVDIVQALYDKECSLSTTIIKSNFQTGYTATNYNNSGFQSFILNPEYFVVNDNSFTALKDLPKRKIIVRQHAQVGGGLYVTVQFRKNGSSLGSVSIQEGTQEINVDVDIKAGDIFTVYISSSDYTRVLGTEIFII